MKGELLSPVRIASVPASQVYIAHCAELPGEPVQFVRLPDPTPLRGEGTEQSGWWPPAMLEKGWIPDHAGDFDLMHVHFGFDALTADELQRVVGDLRAHSKPLVYTVHDLTNPHHTTPGAHDAALDVLVGAADALITLTPGAAAEIGRRWGRTALVLPHPHVVELSELRRRQGPRAAGTPLRFGLHLKSLRPNMAPEPVLEALVAGVRQLAADGVAAVVQVNTHPEVIQGHGEQEIPRLARRLRSLADDGTIDLQVRPYFDETELWSYLASLDASVLAYQWGTHSGWLEACVDLGTAVIAPDCGFYEQQRPVLSYHLGRDGLDPDSLVAAMRRVAAADGHYFRMSLEERLGERRQISARLAELYRSL